MNHALANPRVIAITIAILLFAIWLAILLASRCLCDSCKDPFAIFLRGDLQLCRQCKTHRDRWSARVKRRRSLLRRIWRASA